MSRQEFLDLIPDAKPVVGKSGQYVLPDGSTYMLGTSSRASGNQPSIYYKGSNGAYFKIRFKE
jgi:hypothetical protein